MAKEKISELPAAGTLDGTEEIPGVQGGDTVKMTTQAIADLGGGGDTVIVYGALLSQESADAPVATPVNSAAGNYLGGIVWTRDIEGIYTGTLAAAFPANKTLCFIISNNGNKMSIDRGGDNIVIVSTYNASDVLADGQLVFTTVKIEVYP